ncbi:hypothetical protein ACTFIU_005602 [Dictyostelium citrinum]
MKKGLNLYLNKNLISTFIVFIILFFISQYFYNNDSNDIVNKNIYDILNSNNNFNNNNNINNKNNNNNNKNKNKNDKIRNNIRPDKIINHTKRLIEIGNSKIVYEESRSIAREYIRDYLIEEGGFPKDNIIWNHFEWNERKAEGKNITTTTWTGINIIIWINTTSSSSSSNISNDNKNNINNNNNKNNNNNNSKPIRIISSHYDTKYWGSPDRTSGAHDCLSGTGLVIEEAIALFKHQEVVSKMKGIPNDTPYMFILFDQENPGALGSRSFVSNNKISKMASQSQIAYFLNIDAIGNDKVMIQTLPYEHKHQTLFTPRWLVNSMIQSAYSVNPVDGIAVGSSNVGVSVMYQAHRYHLHSISYLGDEGPFTWAGVDSLLLTDNDYFYGENSHSSNDIEKPFISGELSDQPNHLDPDLLKETADMVYHFLLATSDSSSIPRKDFKNFSTSPTINLLLSTLEKLLNLFFSGNSQYLFIGPIGLGYFQLILISLFLLLFIYFTTFKNYRELVLQYEKCKYQSRKRIYRLKKHNIQNENDESTSEREDKHHLSELSSSSNDGGGQSSPSISSSSSTSSSSGTNGGSSNTVPSSSSSSSNSTTPTFKSSLFVSIRGHRVLFLHLLTMAIVSLIDTVYAFEINVLGFLALATFHCHRFNINLLTGFISGAFCTNFIYKDITQIMKFGRKGNGSQELVLNILLGIYIIHSILIVIYGYDYGKKKEELNKFDSGNKDN